MKVLATNQFRSHHSHPRNAAFPAAKQRSSTARVVLMASALPPACDGRRAALFTFFAAGAAVASTPLPSLAKTATRQAKDFCPPASTEGYVLYTPEARATPSLRAGVIFPDPTLYSFEVPSTWTEGTLLNILTGNFCMPRCDEPWYEALWESSDEGTATLIVFPLRRLVSKPNAQLKDLGTPAQVVESIGNFITGNYLDSAEDVLTADVEEFADGRMYYTYEIAAPYAKVGTHQLAAFTIKGEQAYLWVVAANDKQWGKAEGKLRHMLKSVKA